MGGVAGQRGLIDEKNAVAKNIFYQPKCVLAMTSVFNY